MKKKLLPALLALCMAATLLTSTALAAEFNDVDGHWGKEAIERWADYGVLNGKGDGKFDPNGTMTRAEFATMLVNMMGYTKTSTKTFTDLDPNAWYADAISKLEAAGVMTGVGSGKINPLGKITREQAAVMLCRAFDIKPSGKSGLSFNDSGKVSSWAKDAMIALSERGMINGTGGNLLSPDGIVNRATAAKLTSNMVAEYVTSDTVLTGEIKGVVIVAKGAKVEIKDAVVTAPIVVESASVSLTNTKAENVVAGGTKASVTADEKSSVTDVTVAGTAPAIEINGKVEGTVTVEAGTTGAELKGDGVKTDQVVNNTTEDVKVNGETVKPEDPNKPGEDENKPGTGGNTGSSTGSGNQGSGETPAPTPETPAQHSHTFAWAYDTTDHWKVCACGEIDENNPKTNHDMGTGHACTAGCGFEVTVTSGLNHTHIWADDTEHSVAATCTTDGYKLQKCTAKGDNDEDCTATSKQPIKALGHQWNEGVETTAPTCIKVGVKTFTCQRTNNDVACTETRTEELAPVSTAHVLTDVTFTPSKTDATKHVKICTECNQETSAEAHTFTGAYTKATATTHTQNCSSCTAKETKDCTFDVLDTTATSETKLVYKCKDNCGNTNEVAHTEHTYDQTGDKCICGKDNPATGGGDVPGTDAHQHGDFAYYAQGKKGNGKHTEKCSVSGCDESTGYTREVNCTFENGNESATCKICGADNPDYEEPETHEHQYSNWEPDTDNAGSHKRTCTTNDGTECTGAELTGSCDTAGASGACSKCGYKAESGGTGGDTGGGQGGGGVEEGE